MKCPFTDSTVALYFANLSCENMQRDVKKTKRKLYFSFLRFMINNTSNLERLDNISNLTFHPIENCFLKPTPCVLDRSAWKFSF